MRKQLGKPIASFQLVQKSLVGMMAELIQRLAPRLEVGRLKDAGLADFSHVSMLVSGLACDWFRAGQRDVVVVELPFACISEEDIRAVTFNRG
jgi:alkylation response protein AidB-like acyl-CoA dehydrogenase